MLTELNERAVAVFRHLVDSYLETGQPVGSRLLTGRTGLGLSPASIRSIMAELEHRGLLYAPHTSAGRVPTERGLRLFIDGLMQVGDLSREERECIEAQCAAAGQSSEALLAQASAALSGLSACTGLVVAPKSDSPLRQVEFVELGPRRLLVILVGADGNVENRVMELDETLSAAALTAAANYLNHRILGKSLGEVRQEVERERQAQADQLDRLAQQVVDAGLASWAGGEHAGGGGQLIVRGHAHLLSDVRRMEDLDRVRALFEALEAKATILQLLDAAQDADGVRIFIGAENALCRDAGVSMILAPMRDSLQRVVGAVGVIGPTRLPYARIIPMVDYTASLVSRMLR